MKVNKILFFGLLAYTACCYSAYSQNGYWQGPATHLNTQMDIGIELKELQEGQVGIYFIVPEYGWNIALGTVKISEDTIKLVTGDIFIFSKNKQQITGVLPSFIVPKYEIPFELTKRPIPESIKQNAIDQAHEKAPSYSIDLKSGEIWSPLAADKSFLYFGTSENLFYAIDPFKNKVIWSFSTQGANRGKALINKYIYFYSDDGFVYCLSKKGELIWKFDTGSGDTKRVPPGEANSLYDYYSSAPILHKGHLYVGDIEGNFFSIDAQKGTKIWGFKAKAPVRSEAVIKNNLIVLTSFDGKVYTLDVSTGVLKWTYDTGKPVSSSPVISNNTLIIGSRSCDLIGLDIITGKENWKNYYWFSWVESTGVIANDKVYVGSSDAQNIYCFEVESGKKIWASDIDGSSWLKPVLHNGNLFTGTVGNETYFVKHKAHFVALDKNNGNIKWKFTLPAKNEGYYGFSSSPIVLKDIIWVGTTDGVLYGFKPEI